MPPILRQQHPRTLSQPQCAPSLCPPLLHPPPTHHPCPPPPAASQLQTHNPWTWIVQSPRTPLRPVTTVTSWGTLPGTVWNPVHIKCAMQTPCLWKPSKQSWKPSELLSEVMPQDDRTA